MTQDFTKKEIGEKEKKQKFVLTLMQYVGAFFALAGIVVIFTNVIGEVSLILGGCFIFVGIMEIIIARFVMPKLMQKNKVKEEVKL